VASEMIMDERLRMNFEYVAQMNFWLIFAPFARKHGWVN
jgi:hypothetical protein